jgi:uncharacterized protein YceH (UPF0502 family)
MAIVLQPHELRVLGVLIEKSMTTPEYYPLTLNAITVASNQKNNRDPITSLTEGEVGSALHGLTQWQLVSQAEPDRGSRVNRFRHDVEKRFGWDSPQRAIMAELMLRGPQTLGELKSRASRMTPLQALDHLQNVVEGLRQGETPMIVELPRQPGQSTTRFAHRLGGEVAPSPTPVATTAPANTREASTSLETRVAHLEAKVAELDNRLQAILTRSEN